MPEERLQKIIAQSGLCSRRKAEVFIRDGRVRVNGKVITELGSKADIRTDAIEVSGIGKIQAEAKQYIMLHKPVNTMSTTQDPGGRDTVLDVVESSLPYQSRGAQSALGRVFPVGRLDFDAEGLLIMTNDGELTHKLLHPRKHVPKTYMVKVKGEVTEKALERMRAGMRLPDESGRPIGRHTKPADVVISKSGPSQTWLEMTLFEGRYHQVKRMCLACGLFVNRLVRTHFGGLEIGDLPTGRWRHLRADELRRLKSWS